MINLNLTDYYIKASHASCVKFSSSVTITENFFFLKVKKTWTLKLLHTLFRNNWIDSA